MLQHYKTTNVAIEMDTLNLNYFFYSTYMKLHISPKNYSYAWVSCKKIPKTDKANQPNNNLLYSSKNYFLPPCSSGKYWEKGKKQNKMS